MTTLAEGMLMLLKAEPTLLPPVYGDTEFRGTSLHWMIEQRRHQSHSCLRCPAPARVAYVAHLDKDRWIDLCPACSEWLMGSTQWTETR